MTRRVFPTGVFCSFLALAAIFAANSTAQQSQDAKTWVLLVAVQKHDNPVHNLRYTLRDAALLRKTLQERAGIPGDQIVELSDAADGTHRPTLANLRREVPQFLAKAGPNDRLIVYFSGHGEVRGDKAYLIPADVKVSDIPATGYPTQDLRTALAMCKAKTKFLILDCCHAGGADRALGDTDARPDVLARSLEPSRLTGTVVLASCSAHEKSWEWTEREQGIFTYWLCRGLEGGADENGDGQVDFEEVYRYTQQRVALTAPDVVHLPQTPVRIVGGDVVGTPALLTLRPEPPEGLCRRLAEHLDLEVRRQKLKKVGVLEFIVPLNRVEGLARANLPGLCAARVRDALAKLAGDSYQVLPPEQMADAAKGVRVEELGDPTAMQRIAREGGGLQAVVTGTIRRRGAKLHVQCDLVATATGNSLVTPTGVLPLSEELVGDNGASFDNRTRPNGSPYDPAVVEHVRQEAQQVHPLQNREFPFQLEFYTVLARPSEEVTDRTPRSPKPKPYVKLPGSEGNSGDLVIGVRKDEILEVCVRNGSPNKVALALLINGKNTYGGKLQRLGEATPWVLDAGKTYRFEGFYFPNAPIAGPGSVATRMNRFIVRDVAPVAGRERFDQSPAVITAAFYGESGRDLRIGGRDVDEQRNLQAVDFKVGRLLGVVNIRYVDEKDLN
jgi:uncharacterized caspase-like protein